MVRDWSNAIFNGLLKGSIFLKNGHFIIQERFNKLIYVINTIIQEDHDGPISLT